MQHLMNYGSLNANYKKTNIESIKQTCLHTITKWYIKK